MTNNIHQIDGLERSPLSEKMCKFVCCSFIFLEQQQQQQQHGYNY